MMNKTLPWHDIKTPKDEFSVRQIRQSKNLPLYWGKDAEGHCLFIFEIEANGKDLFNNNEISIYGININLNELKTTGNQALVLTLGKHIDQDLFYHLCQTLIQALNEVLDPLVGLSVALSQIKRWKIFMASANAKILSPEEIRGLFAELIFLKQMIKKTKSEYIACESWQGPETLHQDFIFFDTAVEIKSLSGREKNTIRISSENQLESVNNNLFLKVFRLINMPESEQSCSLNSLVKHIQDSFTDSEALELFYNKLAKLGYITLPAYDTAKFIVADEQTYRLEDHFPKLVRTQLLPGIVNVNYEIKLEAITSYICPENEIWSK
ncbi:PD-(D/E)XK motif protein [Utexia brackfieldae]|uniref:PD-(D/E)XK motif protein n=1 Tax=Utexia brackfieldae TaxID=3074108 RepID=UPI00370D5BEE